MIQDASSFRDMIRRLETLEAQVRKLKLEALQRDISTGVEKLHNGQYSEYDDESLPNLLQTIKQRGQSRLKHDNMS